MIAALQAGRRPVLPAGADERLAGLARRCWAPAPAARPNAGELVAALSEWVSGGAAVPRPAPHRGASPPAQPRGWTCTQCTLVNEPVARVCAVCDAPPGGSAHAAPRSVGAPRPAAPAAPPAQTPPRAPPPAPALAHANLDSEVVAGGASGAVLLLSELVDGRWHPVPGTGIPAAALAQLGPFAGMLMQQPAQRVQKLDWLDMAVPVGSTAWNLGLRTGDRFVACRGGKREWGPRVWQRREDHHNNCGSVHFSVSWPDINGSGDVVPVPGSFAESMEAGAKFYILRGGQALRCTLPVGGGAALGVAFAKPPKSSFYR